MKRHPDLGPSELPLVYVDPIPTALPTIPAAVPAAMPVLEEVDLLRYKLLIERVQRLRLQQHVDSLQLKITVDLGNTTANELGALLDTLGAKYNTDFHTHLIDQDTGHIRPNA